MPASAMRCGSLAMTARRSDELSECHWAISGSVRPQPKHRLVRGSIMQTAMQGVSLAIGDIKKDRGDCASHHDNPVPAFMIGLWRCRCFSLVMSARSGCSGGAASAIGASAVITFLFTWNDFLIALTLTSSKDAQTLPVGLTNFVTQYGIDWGPMAAAGVLMVIPTLIFVWFAQGLLVKGLITGAVRG